MQDFSIFEMYSNIFKFHSNKLSMKKLFTIAMFATALMTGIQASAQREDKSKRPSPPAKVTQKIKSGATISIDYSQPICKRQNHWKRPRTDGWKGMAYRR